MDTKARACIIPYECLDTPRTLPTQRAHVDINNTAPDILLNKQRPGMFLVDTRNGQILTQPQLLGKYTVTLLAADAAGEIAVIKAWQFEVVRHYRVITLGVIIIICTTIAMFACMM